MLAPGTITAGNQAPAPIGGATAVAAPPGTAAGRAPEGTEQGEFAAALLAMMAPIDGRQHPPVGSATAGGGSPTTPTAPVAASPELHDRVTPPDTSPRAITITTAGNTGNLQVPSFDIELLSVTNGANAAGSPASGAAIASQPPKPVGAVGSDRAARDSAPPGSVSPGSAPVPAAAPGAAVIAAPSQVPPTSDSGPTLVMPADPSHWFGDIADPAAGGDSPADPPTVLPQSQSTPGGAPLGRGDAARTPPAMPPVAVAPDEVAVHIARAISSGTDRLQIQLHPTSLGRIDVELDIQRDGRVEMVIRADRAETLELLQRDARQLLRAFQESGLQADSGGISFELRSGNDQQDQRRPTHTDGRPEKAATEIPVVQQTKPDINPPMGGVDLTI